MRETPFKLRDTFLDSLSGPRVDNDHQERPVTLDPRGQSGAILCRCGFGGHMAPTRRVRDSSFGRPLSKHSLVTTIDFGIGQQAALKG